VTESIALPLADTSDMIEMHRVFRNCFGQSAYLVGSVSSDDSPRAVAVASYYANVLRLLRVHHEGEDVLLTPKLLERNPEQAELIERIAAQHTGAIDLIDDAERWLGPWAKNLDGSSREELIRALERLDAELTVHLDAEEAAILPIASRCMNVAEWGELPGHGMQHFDGDKDWLILGLIRDEMSAKHRESMDAHMPAPVADMWTASGQIMYEEFMHRLRGRA
jgi:hypothetical protein